VHTDWAEDADAVLMMFMPGEQVGNALADLLTGKASPAGRLPLTMPTSDENRFSASQYPGECKGHTWCENMTATFSEGVLIGYRWNDATEKPAAYPFGYGLTYTTFEYMNAQAQCKSEKAVVTLQVRNTGDTDGQAVPQLYVGFKSLKPALRQLRGFQKVQVPKGGSADITFFLGQEDWSYYDEKKNKWVSAVSKGEKIDVFLGSSSADLFWNATLSC
jgi:beta-glucosidase